MFLKKILPNAYSLFLLFSTVSTERILLFSILKYRIQKMIPNAYLNLKYNNYKTLFSFSSLNFAYLNGKYDVYCTFHINGHIFSLSLSYNDCYPFGEEILSKATCQKNKLFLHWKNVRFDCKFRFSDLRSTWFYYAVWRVRSKNIFRCYYDLTRLIF